MICRVRIIGSLLNLKLYTMYNQCPSWTHFLHLWNLFESKSYCWYITSLPKCYCGQTPRMGIRLNQILKWHLFQFRKFRLWISKIVFSNFWLSVPSIKIIASDLRLIRPMLLIIEKPVFFKGYAYNEYPLSGHLSNLQKNDFRLRTYLN